MSSKRTKAYLLLLGATILWGAAGPIIKFTLQGIDPIPFLVYRFAISGALATLILLKTGVHLPKSSKELLILFLYSILAVTLGLTVLFLGIDKTTVLDLTLIGSISPIIVVLGGLIFFHEKVTRREQIGIGTALVGTFVAIIAPILGTNAIGLSGNILIFIYVIIDAISVLFAKQLARHRYSQLQTTMIGFQIGFITLLPFALYMHSPDYLISSIIDLPVKYHLGVLYMAIFSGLAAYLLRNRGQQSIEVGEAQLFSYLQPIISVPLAVLWLGEDLTYLFVLGAVIIGAGVTIAEYKSQRRKSVKHTLHPNIAR